jgi:hypothetical protein
LTYVPAFNSENALPSLKMFDMVILGIILLAVFLVFATIAIYGFTQPSDVYVACSHILHVKPEEVFPSVGDFRAFISWSPWSSKDPNMEHRITGNPFEVGSKYEWKGNRHVGSGSLEITHIEANRLVDMALVFGQREALIRFSIEPLNGGCKVTWSMTSNMGNNPFGRAFGPLMRKFVSQDYQLGLRNLEKHIATK